MPRSPSIPLPRGWSTAVRAGVLHAISIASTAMISASCPSSERAGSRGVDRLHNVLNRMFELGRPALVAIGP